jgi:hypothetical protein
MSTATLPIQTATDEAAILELLDSMLRANHDKDAIAFAAQFSPMRLSLTSRRPSFITVSTSRRSRRGSIAGQHQSIWSRAISR